MFIPHFYVQMGAIYAAFRGIAAGCEYLRGVNFTTLKQPKSGRWIVNTDLLRGSPTLNAFDGTIGS